MSIGGEVKKGGNIRPSGKVYSSAMEGNEIRWRDITGYTEFGRHPGAMKRIRTVFNEKERVVAWVIGIGGNISLGNWRYIQPFEHIEVAEMLRRAGVKDFKVYASDINPARIEAAQKMLGEGVIKVNAEDLKLSSLGARNQAATKKYLKIFSGKNDTRGPFQFTLPEGLKEKIVFLGHEMSTGNAFLETPAEQPHLITCFNVSQHYYNPPEKKLLAQMLAEALAPGGILLVNRPSKLHPDACKGSFELELGKRLTERKTQTAGYLEFCKVR